MILSQKTLLLNFLPHTLFSPNFFLVIDFHFSKNAAVHITHALSNKTFVLEMCHKKQQLRSYYKDAFF